jgi:TonB-dependent starch-binding outer membrane protein SusC
MKSTIRTFFYCCLFFYSAQALIAQNPVKLTGTVLDEKNELLPGVSVAVPGKSIGTITDMNGKFSISLPDDKSILVFSFIGFESKSVSVGTNTVLTVQLKEDNKQLDEVVVVGYGSMKKSDLTGSLSQVAMGTMESSSQSNFQSFLQGKSAGVQVTASSGDPGAGVKIEIRGANSLNAGTEPLYVIDGIPMDISAPNQLSDPYASGAPSNPMAAINPNDIASIDILKDASATAIYGSRGANGVILITTKSGTSGAPRLNVSYSQSIATIANKINMLNSSQYAELSNEAGAYKFPSSPIHFTEDELKNLPSSDHQSEIFTPASTKDLSLSMSGGDSKTKYYLSGQYYDQEGIIINTGLSRLNLKMNLERELSDKIKLNASINVSRTESDGTVTGGWNGGVIESALRWAPTSPLRLANGDYNINPTYMSDGTGLIKERYTKIPIDASLFMNNPLAIVNELKNHNTNNQVLANLGLTYKLNQYLKADGKVAMTSYNTLLQAYRPTIVPILASATQGYATVGNSQYAKLLYEGTVTYNRNFGKHNINGVIGSTLEQTITTNQKASAKNFAQDATGYNAIQAGALLVSPYSDYLDSKLTSFLMRANYNFNNKYYLTFSGREDGSSKFARGHRWGFFPSVGLSWRASQEKWLKTMDQISDLKLRTSYGVTGNQSIPSYQTLLQLQSNEASKTNFNFGNSINSGYAPVGIPNQDLTWETTKQFNAGVDLSLFSNRVSFVADVYNKETSNLLYNLSLPATSGFQNMFANIGSIQNKGLELMLKVVPIKRKDFSWSSSFNISWNKNQVTKLSGRSGESIYAGELNSGSGIFLSKVEVGQSIGNFYGYKTDGLWNDVSLATKPTTFQIGSKPGDRKYKDVNPDGVLNADDRTYLGSSLPDFVGGFFNSFQYKSVELSFAFNFSYGNKMFNQLFWSLDAMDGTYNASANALNRWKPITANMTAAEQHIQQALNATTNVPRAGNFSTSQQISDYFVQDASFIRCSNVSLSWNVPHRWNSAMGVKNLKILASVQNLFTLSPYQGYNPEGNSFGASNLVRGVDGGLYPIARTFKIGLTATL